MTTPWLGCVADDFTGGTDVAAALRRSGLRTRLFFGAPEQAAPLPECDAVVVALKTRSAPVEQAAAESTAVVRWLNQRGVERIYVKYCSTFDSTPAGNIGPIIDATLTELGETATVLCPASPEHGRTVFHGHLFVGDRLLSESSMATHPLTPMTDADLRRVLAPETPHTAGLLDHAALAAGVDTAAQQLEDLRDSGVRHIIADAVDEFDLITLAAATQQWPVLTGGAGLARAVAKLRPAPGPAAPMPLPGGPSVVIAGSCSTATLGQVEHARLHMAAHHITPATSDDPDEIWSRARAWLDEHASADSVLVYATASADERARTQHIFGDKTAEIVEDILAKTAKYAVANGARRVVVAGGETSGAVVAALGVGSVLVAQEMETGVPWCLTTAQPELALLLKSGNFGQPDLLTKAAMTP
jgi:3-dehydrotetronate 4-kinase